MIIKKGTFFLHPTNTQVYLIKTIDQHGNIFANNLADEIRKYGWDRSSTFSSKQFAKLAIISKNDVMKMIFEDLTRIR